MKPQKSQGKEEKETNISGHTYYLSKPLSQLYSPHKYTITASCIPCTDGEMLQSACLVFKNILKKKMVKYFKSNFRYHFKIFIL